MEKTETFHVKIPKELIVNFEAKYPRCRTRLIKNLFELCLEDNNFFERVFFKDLLKNN